MVVWSEGCGEIETTTVEVDKEREFLVRVGEFWEEEASGEVYFWDDSHIFG